MTRPLAPLALLATLAGPAVAQDLLHKLTADDADVQDFLGSAVALSGDRAVLGAPGDDDLGEWSGSAYVFDLLTGQQVLKLKPSDGAAGNLFGLSVAIGDAHVVVLAPGKSTRAYVFDASTGQELYQFAPTGGGLLGIGVDADGTRAIVSGLSLAYVFDLTNGQQLLELSHPDGAAFGGSVSISGDRALVGARNHFDKNGVETGAAYVIDLNTGDVLLKLEPSDGEHFDRFGESVSLSGDRALVGTKSDFGNDKAYVFDATTGAQLFRLETPDESRVGADVALAGERAILTWESGAYFFDVVSGLPLFGLENLEDEFGRWVAIDPKRALVAARWDDTEGIGGAGSGYLYRVPATVGASYCGPATPNSSGLPAEIQAIGRDVSADNLFVLLARQLPKNQFGYFLASMTQGFVANPGGSQGNLCLGGEIGRLTSEIRYSGVLGGFTVQVDLTAIPVCPPHAVQPGETWNFQAWFRDMNPGPTSNFTDGVSVLFQ